MNVISAEAEVLIECEPEIVFAYFADLRNEPKWNRGHVKDVTMTSSEPIGLGTTFEGKHSSFGKATWRLAEYDPPQHIVVDGLVGNAPYRYVGNLERLGRATMFRGRIEWEPHGVWRKLGSLLPFILKVQTKRSFRHLRDAINQITEVKKE